MVAETARPSALGVDGEQARHILVVDDDDRLRSLLDRYLRDHGYRVTGAKDAADARAKLAGMAFDLVIVDVMMPGENGIDLTRALREDLDLPILMLTAMGEPEARINGLEAGADDYLAKPFEPRELLLRISTILRRTGLRLPPPPRSPSLLKLGAYRFDTKRNLLLKGSNPIKLTTTEIELLRILAAAPGRTVARDALCKQLGADPTGRALDVQITRLRRKFEPNPKEPRYLVTVWGEGYVLRPDRES
jgi:two-component system phosphate regulon response regulator OmpR